MGEKAHRFLGCDEIIAEGYKSKGPSDSSALCIEVFWCMTHRFEISLKDALISIPFKDIDKMLMHDYYAHGIT